MYPDKVSPSFPAVHLTMKAGPALREEKQNSKGDLNDDCGEYAYAGMTRRELEDSECCEGEAADR